MKNKITKTDLTIGAILAAVLVWLMAIYAKLPETVPTHFNFAGEADGWGSKKTIFIMWFVAAGMDILMKAIRKLDPKSENYDRFEKFFNLFRVVMVVFMLGINVLIVKSAQGIKMDITSIIFVATGLLLSFIGNSLPKIKFNYTTGIKTPWTLASENVWNKTHRMAGKIWVVGGLLIALTAFIRNRAVAITAFFVALFAMVIVPMAYSYIEFNKEKKENNNEEK